MKLKKWLWVVFLSTCIHGVNAQYAPDYKSQLQIKAGLAPTPGGSALVTGKFIAAGYQYLLGKWGFVVDATTLRFSPAFNLGNYAQQLSGFAGTITGKEHWRQSILLAGPIYQFGRSSVLASLGFKAGAAFTNAPQYALHLANTDTILASINGTKSKVALALQPQLNVTWFPKNGKLGVQLGLAGRYTAENKAELRYKNTGKVDFTADDQLVRRQLMEAPPVNTSLTIPSFIPQPSLGISYRFGKTPTAVAKTQVRNNELNNKPQTPQQATANKTETPHKIPASNMVVKKKKQHNKMSEGIQMDILEVQCRAPNFDSLGNKLYTVKLDFYNPATSNANWVVNSIDNSTNGTNTTAFYDCNNTSLPPVSTITILPGATTTKCIFTTVPIASNTLTLQANGTKIVNGVPTTAHIGDGIDSLPNCICNTCDIWNINSTNDNITRPGQAHQLSISSTISIANANPIKQVKAELVFIRHSVNNKQCYTCTKDDDRMGLFAAGRIHAGNWLNGGTGNLQAADANADGFANQLLWQSTNPATGIDFSTPRTISSTINVPHFSTLNCCTNKYKICIRYTFTDIDCNVCSYLVCYNYNNSPDGETPIEEAENTEPSTQH